MTEQQPTTDLADTIIAGLEPHGWTGLVMADSDNPALHRIARAGGGTVAIERTEKGWSYSAYGPDDVEPYAGRDHDDLDFATLAADVVLFTRNRACGEPHTDLDIRAALERILDGNPPGRPIDDVMRDYQDRFGLVMPDMVDPGAVWAVLLVEPGDDPELVPLYMNPGAAHEWMCACGATLSDGTDDKGRMSCETCGKYYTDNGIALPHPEDMRS